MKKFELPRPVLTVLQTIERAGFEAWCVGGCVRDMLMGVPVHDYDIASSAPAERMHDLFDKTIDTGIAHGTVTVLVGNEAFEVTQYRIDGDYPDSRHPQSVQFTDRFELDLSRRDFTMNAIGYHPERGLFDPFDGRSAIERGEIVAVGDAATRFTEDALRIMRAFRFASTLGFAIESKTLSAAVACREKLKNISAERIWSELYRLLGGRHPSVLGVLCDTDLTKLDAMPSDPIVRFSALCCLLDRDAEQTAVFLKTDRITRRLAAQIADAMHSDYPQSKSGIKFTLQAIPFSYWQAVLQCMAILQDKPFSVDLLQQIEQNAEPYLPEHLALTAEQKRDLSQRVGGQQMKRLMHHLVRLVIEHPEQNTASNLQNRITQMLQNS